MAELRKNRIWELDALRGFCILCVIVVHFFFDLVYFTGMDPHFPALCIYIQEYGGTIFVVLSGVCVTLGSRSVRRGAIVFGCGMGISLVTYAMYRLGLAGRRLLSVRRSAPAPRVHELYPATADAQQYMAG